MMTIWTELFQSGNLSVSCCFEVVNLVDKFIEGIHDTWMFSWFVSHKGLKLHVKSRFYEYNFNFHKFDIIINKMMPILFCSTAVQGISM